MNRFDICDNFGERLTEWDADIAAVDVVGDGGFIMDQSLLPLQRGPVAVI